MIVKIEVTYLSEVKPKIASQGGLIQALEIDIYQNENQMRDLFYELWSFCGTDDLRGWVEAEGFDLKKQDKGAE
jgi:hypothetical protein